MTTGITNQKGLSLMEVLVALVVLSVGLLGIAGMQATGLRNNHAAYTKTQATALAMDMTDRIRANPSGAAHYHGFDTKVAVPADPTCITAGCTAAQMATYDKYQWSQPLVSTTNPILPEGRGMIGKAGDVFTITLLWREPGFKGVERPTCVTGQADDVACLQMSFQP